MQTSRDDDRRLSRDLEEQVRRLKAENALLKSQLDTHQHRGWVNEACGDDLWDL